MIFEKDKLEIITKLSDQRRLIRESLKTEEARRSRAENFSDRELARTMISKLKSQSARVETAIHRLEEGEYDRCAHCGNQISSERLLVLPYTTLCKTCAVKTGNNTG